MAALGFTDGELVSATPIHRPTLGRGPRDVSADEAEDWALVGWRDSDDLDPAAIDGAAVQIARGASALARPSFGRRAVDGRLAGDFEPWAEVPALFVPGLRACPDAVPEGAHLALSCGPDTCVARIRQLGCTVELDADGCGLTAVSGRVQENGAIDFDPASTACSAEPGDAPGAALTLRCTVSAATCVGRVLRPGGPPRIFARRQQLFSPPGDTTETIGSGWMPEPAVHGSRVVVLQRATSERAACPTAGPAMLHLLDAETLEVVRTSSAASCTWRVRMLDSGEILSLEGGPRPAVQRWSPELRPQARVSVALAGDRFFPAATDRIGDRVMILWDDLDEQGPLARATRVEIDGSLTTVELDTRRVSGVALRPDGRFIVLDHTDRRVSLHALTPGGREDSYRVGILSRPLRALVHHPEPFETWLAVGGAVSPQIVVTGPGDFRSPPRVTPVSEVLAEPWTLARWPPAPHRALAAFVARSGAGAAYLGLVDPGLDPPLVLRGLTEVGSGPVLGGEADERGRVWLALPAEGAVVRVEPW